MLEKYGARRIIALSSTSRFTKSDSADSDEKISGRLNCLSAEDRLQQWAKDQGLTG